MNKTSLHPATCLLGWLSLLVAVQCLSGTTLLIACLIVPLCGKRVTRRGVRLIWRARWLLVSLLIVFAWGVTGEPLWDSGMAPTFAGIDEALKHFGRLFLVLVVVAAFLEFMPLPDLLAATHTLLTPFRRLGMDADRGMVRLILALRCVENLPRPRDWRSLLEIPENTSGEEMIEIDCQPLRRIDGCLIAGGLGGLLLLCFR
ncbi:MAG: energy-coupling factor transporter transmembrane protein EcfT [Candidatus Accumulibacter sp.]|nr:energy-coupling factor transporter transmembrane protein EcfT [Accumulibacter sp.]